MKRARHDPGAGEKLALAWHERGGAHPADHCAAVALIGLKQYKEAAIRLDALAQGMTTAPAGLRAEVLDQAGQAWGLAGDPVRAYAAAGASGGLGREHIRPAVRQAADGRTSARLRQTER